MPGFPENPNKEKNDSVLSNDSDGIGDMLNEFLGPEDPGVDIGDLLDEVTGHNPESYYADPKNLPAVPPRSSRPGATPADSDLPPVHRHLKPKPPVPVPKDTYETRVVAAALYDPRTTQQEQPFAHDDDFDDYGPLPALPEQSGLTVTDPTYEAGSQTTHHPNQRPLNFIPTDTTYETGPQMNLGNAHANGPVIRPKTPPVSGHQ